MRGGEDSNMELNPTLSAIYYLAELQLPAKILDLSVQKLLLHELLCVAPPVRLQLPVEVPSSRCVTQCRYVSQEIGHDETNYRIGDRPP